MVERRRSDPKRTGRIPGKRSGFDDLIDEARKALAFGVRRVGTGIDLDLGVTQRGCRAGGIIIERTIDGYAVELVTDLIVVAAADVDRGVIPGLVRNNVRTGNCRNGRIRLIDEAAAAERRGMLLRG